ncbi:MAG: hypothetical protein K0U54_00540 [Bacteroidetes bacterium]|nr:hypothetical protein [Bacteroidota bacterium]
MKYIYMAALLLVSHVMYAQVGINTTNPSSASVLDVSSTNDNTNYGGFLPPRVNLAQRNTIPVTVSDDGMMIYLIEGTTRCVQVYDGVDAVWENVYCMPVNAAPVASLVHVSGCEIVGETLSANYTYSDTEGDAEGTTTFQWYRANDALGTGAIAIPGATASTYTLIAADATNFIAIEVTPVASTGTLLGSPVVSTYEGGILASGSCGPTLLGVQDFELIPSTPTLALFENTAGYYESGNSGTGEYPQNADKFVSSTRSYAVSNATNDIDLGPVDASAYSDASVFLKLASFSKTSGNGADGSDYVDIYISLDGGVTFSLEMTVDSGGPNRRWDYDATGNATHTYDGDNVTTTFSSTSGGTGISTLEINGIPNSANLLVGIIMENTDGNEIWIIDDVEVYGNN